MSSTVSSWLKVLAAILLCPPMATACHAGATEAGPGAWRVSLTSSATRVLPKEPVLITVRMSYVGETPFKGYVSSSRVGVRLLPPSNVARSLWFGSLSYHGFADEIPPAQGGSYTSGYAREVNIVALYDEEREAFLFEEPGVCTLEGVWDIWRGASLEDYTPVRLPSLPVRIETARLPDGEHHAIELWNGRRQAEMFLSGAGDESTAAKLKLLADRYPRSAYAKYALMALAQHCRARRQALAMQALDPAERAQQGTDLANQETALLEQIVDRYPPFGLTALVLDRLIGATSALRDGPRVSKYANMLLALPNVPQEYRSLACESLEKSRGRTTH